MDTRAGAGIGFLGGLVCIAREWLPFGMSLLVAAAATAASVAAALATGLIFHFHPPAIAVGAPWLYRRLTGERPCPTRSVAFLVALAALIAAAQDALAPRGLADPALFATPLALLGLLIGGWILLRPGVAAAASHDRSC